MDGIDTFIGALMGGFAVFILMVIVGLSGGFDPIASCQAGQAEIRNVNKVITACVVFPAPPPPGYVPAPGTPPPATAPAIVPPVYIR